jgi:hypothetical protein
MTAPLRELNLKRRVIQKCTAMPNWERFTKATVVLTDCSSQIAYKLGLRGQSPRQNRVHYALDTAELIS